ncbi:MAG: hypothetical protein FWD23_00115 [Oscillospiraceae bacterium]|nr:hypothetical protein [Oscillospiraceae bacterium]
MSHSKYQQRKKGFSLYIDKWNPSAKKYINICCICGSNGYNPVILEDEFDRHGFEKNRIIRDNLLKTHNPLPLDDLKRCEICANIQDRKQASQYE